jgi:cysteine synthase B
MILRGRGARADIQPGQTLIEATSGNTGIALAMAAAIRGYRMILVMPENQSIERRQTMRAFGAELVLTPKEGGMELARDVAERMRDEGRGVILDQFANPDNPVRHIRRHRPRALGADRARITHFVSSMGTTGTIMGVSRYLKERTRRLHHRLPAGPRARRFPASASGRRPTCRRIYDKARVDRFEYVSPGRRRGDDPAPGAGGGHLCRDLLGRRDACRAALAAQVENAVIVSIVCDRGDRYLSTGVFPA